jgi:hypothetical protein
MYTVAVTGMQHVAEPQWDEIPFSVGNPSVEHVTGTLHLYRKNPSEGVVWSLSRSTHL